MHCIYTIYLRVFGIFVWSVCGLGCAAQSPPETPSRQLWGYALHGLPITSRQIAKAENTTGLKPNIILFYLQWPPLSAQDNVAFPEASIDTIQKHDALPCISWEPMYLEDGKEHMIGVAAILNGKYDDYIRRFADRARAMESPLLLRFAHEMNLERYHWGTNQENYGPESPKLYRKMYRHVVDIFRKADATNVSFIWCPNAESVPNTSFDPSAGWNVAKNYYPGDKYVDIVGMDGYNWGDTQTVNEHGWQSRWQSAEEIFGPIYEQIQNIAPEKPLLVCEFGSAHSGGNRRQWFAEAIAVFQEWNIDGAIWFQANSELDWRLNRPTVTDSPGLSPLTQAQLEQWIMEIMDNGQK